ncbi:TPA: hypothetical protein ACFP41_001993 [Neisseria weaveri]
MLSDDSLVKQFDSRRGEDFGADKYEYLPDIIYEPTRIYRDDKKRKIYLTKQIEESWYFTVIKYLEKNNELYLESYRRTDEKKMNSTLKKYIRLK